MKFIAERGCNERAGITVIAMEQLCHAFFTHCQCAAFETSISYSRASFSRSEITVDNTAQRNVIAGLSAEIYQSENQ